MALKLESSLIVPAMESVQTVEPGEEGLWSNIKDSLAYMFTSDSSIAEKIGNMCYWLDKMDEDQQKALESVQDAELRQHSDHHALLWRSS